MEAATWTAPMPQLDYLMSTWSGLDVRRSEEFTGAFSPLDSGSATNSAAS